MVLKKFNIIQGNFLITKSGGAKAFSLVEMLMALLVASLLLAALAPVMTKKMNENIDVSLFGDTKTIEPCAFVNDTLDTDTDRECVVPEDAQIASAIIVSGGGGGAGATDGVDDPNIHISETYRGNEGGTHAWSLIASPTFNITRDMSDIELEMVSGGEGGGLGNSNGGGAPLSQADCVNFGNGKTDTTGHKGTTSNPILVYDKNNNMCVTTYDQKASTDCVTSTLNGLTIPICNYDGAVAACNELSTKMGSKFFIPTSGQMQPWKGSTSSAFAVAHPPNGINADGFCDWPSSLANETYCYKTATPTSYPDTIAPRLSTIWTSTFALTALSYCTGDDKPNLEVLQYVSHSYNGYPYISFGGNCRYAKDDGKRTYARVRCATTEAPKFAGYTGAGGNGGRYAKVKLPNEILKKAFEITYNASNNAYTDDTTPIDKLSFNFAMGAGGKAAERSSSGDLSGAYTGGITYARLAKKGQTVWGIDFYGSGAQHDPIYYQEHSSATTSANGISYDNLLRVASYQNVYSSNVEFRTRRYGTLEEAMTEAQIIETKDPIRSNTIVSSAGVQINNNVLGASGASYWNGIYRARSASDTAESAQPGSGGIGGYCTQGTARNKPNCVSPTSGTPGAARFTYKRSYPGIGGNGGNAGSVLHIKNLQVNKGDVIKVHTGAPGSGGMANNDGHQGGNSWIEINGKRYEVVGGKGGKTGIAANPSVSGEANKFAKPGNLQTIAETDIITSETKMNLALLGDKNYEIFPNVNNNDEKLLSQGKQAVLNSNDVTIYKAAGGNGGANIKTTPLAGLKGIPCGAFSSITMKIGTKEYKCGSKELSTSNSFNPNPLYRTLSESDLKIKVSNYINSYAPGATGGAGAGWSNDYKTGNTPKTGQGADGMGGYVLIYFK